MSDRYAAQLIRLYPVALLVLVVISVLAPFCGIGLGLGGVRIVSSALLIWWIQFSDGSRAWWISFLWIVPLLVITIASVSFTSNHDYDNDPTIPLDINAIAFFFHLGITPCLLSLCLIWFGSYGRCKLRFAILIPWTFVVLSVAQIVSTKVTEFSSNERVEFPSITDIELDQTRVLFSLLIAVLGIGGAIAIPHRTWLGFGLGTILFSASLIWSSYESVYGTVVWHLAIEREVLHPTVFLVSVQNRPAEYEENRTVVQGELGLKNLPPDCIMTIERVSATVITPNGFRHDISCEQPMLRMLTAPGSLVDFEHKIDQVLQSELSGYSIQPQTKSQDRTILFCELSDDDLQLYSRLLPGCQVELNVVGKIVKLVPVARLSLKDKSETKRNGITFKMVNAGGKVVVNEVGSQNKELFQEDDFCVLIDPRTKSGTTLIGRYISGGFEVFEDKLASQVPIFPPDNGLSIIDYNLQPPPQEDEVEIIRPLAVEYEATVNVEAKKLFLGGAITNK